MSLPDRKRALLLFAFALFALGYLALPLRHGFTKSETLAGFTAFYCAGQAVRTGHDPYRVEPLRSCEKAMPAYPADIAGNVEPAPLPPFVLAGFALLSIAPFPVAVMLDLAAQFASIGIAIWCLRRLTSLSTLFLGAVFLCTALYTNMLFGEIPPLVIGCLCLAGYLTERKRFVWAAVAATAALIEPHVGAPAIVAMFVALPRTRVPFIIAAVILTAISVAAVGMATSIEYFLAALPVHAASEIGASDQFSLTFVLHMLGVPDTAALRLGTASYVLMALVGIVFAGALARRLHKPAILATFPAACAMLGGTFIHDIQLPIALPAALLLLDAGGPLVWLSGLAVVALAVPWRLDRGAVAAEITLFFLAAGAPLLRTRRVAMFVAASTVYAGILALAFLLPHTPTGIPASALPFTGSPTAIASVSWGQYVRETAYGHPTLQTIALKLPYWMSLIAIVLIGIAYAQRRLAAVRRRMAIADIGVIDAFEERTVISNATAHAPPESEPRLRGL